jgi:3-oxoacyl-[acyl-carrier-protein] synthase II
MEREVVITGLGVVSALGLSAQELWTGLVEGVSGLGTLERMDASGFGCRIGGEVKGLKVRDYLPKHYRKATKVMARDIELAMAASTLAVRDAGMTTRADEGEATIAASRLGCQIGAGLIAAETAELSRALASAVDEDGVFDLGLWGTVDGDDGRKAGGGMNNLPPLWLLKYLPNMLACHVTIVHGAEGPSNTITCAEASALLSLGESSRVIERSDADVCFSGGAESKLNYMGVLRLDLSGRVASTDETEDGSQIVRPFSPDSQGGVLGEAGAVLMLEEAACAAGRGAKVYAKVSGFGAAQSPESPIGTGVWEAEQTGVDRGLADAIEASLGDAGLDAGDIDAIVPLGLGVPGLDEREAGALRAVFGDRLSRVPLVTLTPNVGNCSAGQGGLMAAVAAMALERQALPARVNSGQVFDGLDAGASRAIETSLKHIVVCASGLGGQSAALVLSAP